MIEVEGSDPITVMFNPGDYTVSTEAEMPTTQGIGGKDSAPQSTNEQNPSFNKFTIKDFIVKLLFDTYEQKSDVRMLTNKIAKLVIPTVEKTKRKTLPVCRFVWGGFTYKGWIYRLDQKFTLFLPDGKPARAELTVTFKAAMTPEEYKKNMGIEACRKIWKVKSGDRLDLIAQSMLKNVNLWRKIAEENNINDPIAFPTFNDIGRILIIPD
jgi:hypothetical protein